MNNQAMHRCAGPIRRRSFLEIGSLALGGLGLADLLRLRAAAKSVSVAEPDTSVILVWLQGGPSHMETYDLKPRAPLENRGEFYPIPTNVPGIELCEHLPRHAKIADKLAVIRSISHGFGNHAGGAGRFLSGRDPLRPLDPVAQFPCLGPMVAKMRESRDVGVPNYISSVKRVYGGGSSYLGEALLPFVVAGDPNTDDFQVQNLSLNPRMNERLDDRRTLLRLFDNFRRDVDRGGSMEAMDTFNQRAMSLLTSDKARNAFDISQEDSRTRERYGRSKWGQRALLARRLVEAGCSFVTMQMRNVRTEFGGKAGNWDDHAVNWNIFDEMKIRLPVFDQAIAALIEDLYQRGLDRKVMVIVSGEFGRTPRVTQVNGRPGRNHWPGAMSVLVSGGGLKTGQVIGSTTSKGEYAKDDKLDPNDLLATVYRFLGIDWHTAILDHAGRPMPILPHGEPIAQL